MSHSKPRMVRMDGSRMICAKLQTCSVESIPSAPCTRTDEPSLSTHCAIRQAHARMSFTLISQPLLSTLFSHLSIELLRSLQASTNRLSDSSSDPCLSVVRCTRRHSG